MSAPEPHSPAFRASADLRHGGGISRETANAIIVFGLSLLLILGSRFVSPALGSWNQVLTVLMLASFLIVLAFGQGLVILVGGLDLSIPAVITLGGVLATGWADAGSAWYVLPAILVLCGLVGAFNGLGVTVLKIPPFIMTMAVQSGTAAGTVARLGSRRQADARRDHPAAAGSGQQGSERAQHQLPELRAAGRPLQADQGDGDRCTLMQPAGGFGRPPSF